METEDGYVLLELMEPEPRVGDEITGIHFAHGRQRIQARGRELSVYVQHLDATWESTLRGMGL